MYKIVPSNQFKKDLKLAKKRGLDLSLLQSVVSTLADGEDLELFLFRTGSHSDFFKCYHIASAYRVS